VIIRGGGNVRIIGGYMSTRVPGPNINISDDRLDIREDVHTLTAVMLSRQLKPPLGIGLFAFAGLACSSFFPLTIGIASARFAAHGPWVASMMIAALMVGVGLGSYAVGLLRHEFGMETLYRLSAMYPLLALLLAAAALRLGRKGDIPH